MTDFNSLVPAAQARHLLHEWAQGLPQPPPLQPELLLPLTALCQVVYERRPEDINIDFADIRSTLLGSSSFAVASATAAGFGRAAHVTQAVLAALPYRAPRPVCWRLLLAISSPATAGLEMDELMEIIETIQDYFGPAAELIFGYGQHPLAEGAELQLWLLAASHSPILPTTISPRLPLVGALPTPPALDPAFHEAAQLVVNQGFGSSALLQRHLRTGYNRTGRLLEQLLQAGIVAAPTAADPKCYPAAITSEMQLLARLAQLASQS